MALGIKPTNEVSRAVRSLVDEHGVSAVALMLGIGREATSRIAAGFGVRKGTLALATKKLGRTRSKRQ